MVRSYRGTAKKVAGIVSGQLCYTNCSPPPAFDGDIESMDVIEMVEDEQGIEQEQAEEDENAVRNVYLPMVSR